MTIQTINLWSTSWAIKVSSIVKSPFGRIFTFLYMPNSTEECQDKLDGSTISEQHCLLQIYLYVCVCYTTVYVIKTGVGVSMFGCLWTSVDTCIS